MDCADYRHWCLCGVSAYMGCNMFNFGEDIEVMIKYNEVLYDGRKEEIKIVFMVAHRFSDS